jgi:YebC/PmpR family DNA-binding regulatory protein
MGRAFEYRRARKEKRWDKMAKAFTRWGKEISIAVKTGGPAVETNARLRAAIQNAKSVNMPKDRIDAAIKRASSKDEKDFEEVVYEGYGPYGVAILVETATDNPTRTVANIRLYFSKGGGAMGNSGSLSFIFERKGLFRLPKEGQDIEDLQLELIDFGAEDVQMEDDQILVYTPFSEFGVMQKALEDRKIPVISTELVRLPNTTVELTPEQEDAIMNLIDKIEEDDDVQAVFYNVA